MAKAEKSNSVSSAETTNTGYFLLRGLGRSSAHWGPFMEAAAKEVPGMKIEAMDTAGNGDQNDRRSFANIEDYAEDLRLRSELIKSGKKIHLVCLSMGGMIGVAWAELYPHDIASLTLINTSDAGSAHFYERLLPQNYGDLVRLLSPGKSEEEREKIIVEMTAPRLRDKEKWISIFSKFPQPSRISLVMQLWAASRYKFPKTKPLVPVQLIVGKGDGFVDPICSHRLSVAWNIPLIEHPEASHDLPIEEPVWLWEKIRSFVKKLKQQQVDLETK